MATQVLELLKIMQTTESTEEQSWQKQNWKINNFSPGARAFHSSAHFSRAFKEPAGWKAVKYLVITDNLSTSVRTAQMDS